MHTLHLLEVLSNFVKSYTYVACSALLAYNKYVYYTRVLRELCTNTLTCTHCHTMCMPALSYRLIMNRIVILRIL